MSGIRASVRIPLELPVQVRWKSARGAYRQVRGKTGPMSGNGLFMIVPVRPPRRTPITFTIPLPAEITKVPLELYCQGRVVRRSQPGERSGVAAVIDDYRLRRVH